MFLRVLFSFFVISSITQTFSAQTKENEITNAHRITPLPTPILSFKENVNPQDNRGDLCSPAKRKISSQSYHKAGRIKKHRPLFSSVASKLTTHQSAKRFDEDGDEYFSKDHNEEIDDTEEVKKITKSLRTKHQENLSEYEIECPQKDELQIVPVCSSTPTLIRTSSRTHDLKRKQHLHTHSATSASKDTSIQVLPTDLEIDSKLLNSIDEQQSTIDECLLDPLMPCSSSRTPQKSQHQSVVISPTSQGFITPKRRSQLKKGGVDSPSMIIIEALNRFSRDPARLTEKLPRFPLNFEEDAPKSLKPLPTDDQYSHERIYFSVEDELQSILDWDQLEEFLPFLEEYKGCQPKPVVCLPQQLRRMIDQHIFIIMGYSRSQINQFIDLGFVGYYPRDVYFLPSTRLSDEQRREERRKLETIMLEINSQIPSSPGVSIDFSALEDFVISPFEAWIKNHKKQGTQFSLDFETINLALYDCLEDALNKDLYRIIFLPEGYIIIYSPLLNKKWKNPHGESNKKLTGRKKSPVCRKGITLEAHHVAGDIMTDPDCYPEMKEFLKTGQEYSTLPRKELFSKACILFILSSYIHDRDIHPYPYNPNRAKFTKIREKGNTRMHDEHFSK